MNTKPTIEQLVRQKLLLNERIAAEKQTHASRKNNSSTYSFNKLRTAQKLHQLNALNNKSLTQNKKWTLGIFILIVLSVSSIYFISNISDKTATEHLLTGAVTGIPTHKLAIKSIGSSDDLISFKDTFDTGIDNTKYYNGTNNLIIMYSQNANNLNGGILINGSVSSMKGNATLTTAKNISLNVFNVSVTINLSDTSQTLVGNSYTAAGLGLVNQTDFTNFFKCEITLNSAGAYTHQIRNSNGPAKNTSSVTTGAGTLRLNYDNVTNIITCDFAGSSISYAVTNIGEEYGLQLEGSIGFSGPSTPTGSINVTFDNFNYTATKRGPQCGILTTSATLAENLETTAGNCFNITSSHVVVDCMGHTISYGDDAINLLLTSGQGNITIKNCIFNQNIKGVSDSQAIKSYGGFFNNTFWNNTIYSYSDVGAITIWNNNNTNISYNTIIQNGSYTGNGSGMDIQQSYNLWIDNNIVNTTAVGATAIVYSVGNASIRNNRLNTTSTNANALSLTSMIQGTTISENTLITSATGGIGLSSIALAITTSNNIIIRSNKIKALGASNDAFDLDTINNSLIDNNTIENNAVSAFAGALGLLGITANNIIVNNNITAPQGGNEIIDSLGMGADTTYYNYLIYNNSFGEITWQNNGTGGFLRTLTISVNGSLSLDETIFIGNNTAALNTSAFTPVQMINSSANITLYGLDLATVGEIRKVYNFTMNSTEIKSAGIDCNATASCSILSYISNTLRFNTTGFSSFSANLSAPSGGPANSRPTAPAYLQIDYRNLTATTNRTPIFIWQNATDTDGDIFSYHIEVDDNALFNNPEINVTAIAPTPANANTTYYAATTLNVDTRYFWRVRANDSTGYGTWSNSAILDGPSSNSNTSNFTVDSLLQLSFVNNKVEFGTQDRGANISSATSTTDTILPLRAENTGNIYMNITFNATSYFSSVNMNTSSYQFRIAENESNSFSIALSSMSWTNMTLKTTAYHLVNLSWENIKNDFLLDLNISLPFDESAGLKTSTIQLNIISNQ